MVKILLIDDDVVMLSILSKALKEDGNEVYAAKTGTEGIEQVRRQNFDIVFSDIKLPDIGGLEILKEIRQLSPSTLVINMTAFGTIKDAVEAMKLGATEYIVKPFALEEIKLLVRRLRSETSPTPLTDGQESENIIRSFVHSSPAMQKVFASLQKTAPTESNILITGENGVGKDLVARFIHHKSKRSGKTFLPVNCAAIPREMFEGEMFGYEKGAFTGAIRNREGMFSLADGGTLFLDEIGSMPLDLQGKLLRAIETREVMKVGAHKLEKVDVRIIAATNTDLAKAVANQQFRMDLYYRLKVIELDIPPLRERVDDIPTLVAHQIEQYNKRLGKNIKGVSLPVMEHFRRYSWPGNVRELRNVIERGMILCEGETIDERDVPMEPLPGNGSKDPESGTLKEGVDEYEKRFITRILDKTGQDRKKAAEMMGIGLSSLYRKLEEHGLK